LFRRTHGSMPKKDIKTQGKNNNNGERKKKKVNRPVGGGGGWKRGGVSLMKNKSHTII